MTFPDWGASGSFYRAVGKQIPKRHEKGESERIGPAKGGHWEVIE